MGYTFVEKVLMQHTGLEKIQPGQIVTIEPDRVMSHDNSAFIIKKFKKTGVKNVWNKDKIVIIFDHCVPAVNPEHKKNHEQARVFVKEQSLPNFYDDKAGVSHQVMVEEGFVLPGQIILGADSHSTLYGAMSALGVPINRTEMAGIWATGKIWLKVPETIKIILEGKLPIGVCAKDIVLKLLGDLRADGARYKVIEYTGPAIQNLTMASRMTLANMGVELGAKATVFPCDEKTKTYLKGRAKKTFKPIEADNDATYEKEITLDLSTLTPQISCPHTVDNVKELKEVSTTKIDQGYLGSCTNGRIEDLQTAANILKGNHVAEGVRLVVYPASQKIKAEAEQLGILQDLRDAGAEIMTASCGPCFGAVGATLKDGQVCISSSNRNFCGRMGSKKSFVYLASPAVVAASCIKGHITDPRKYIGERI